MIENLIKKQQRKLDSQVKAELNQEKIQRKIIKGKHLKKMMSKEYRSEKYENIMEFKEQIKNEKIYN